jgi:hypothetical protein
MPSPNRANDPDTTSIHSFLRLKEYVQQNRLGEVDSREWRPEWRERWVVFADLIAFAVRSKRSRDVVLNNIIRFDRASAIARKAIPKVRVFRFSDSTFSVADDFTAALSYGIAIHHACLALNVEYMERASNPLFIHIIAPRVTLAQGPVLNIPEKTETEKRFDGIDPRTLIAGGGIVKAHDLERSSAGGLLTTDLDGAREFGRMSVRGGPSSTQNFIRAWQKKVSKARVPSGALFVRGTFFDVPWLLLRPIQQDATNLWCAERSEATAVITDYLKLWELGAREFYSPAGFDNPLDTTKHFSAAIRHGVNCAQARVGQLVARYYSIEAALEMLKAGRAE